MMRDPGRDSRLRNLRHARSNWLDQNRIRTLRWFLDELQNLLRLLDRIIVRVNDLYASADFLCGYLCRRRLLQLIVVLLGNEGH